MSGVDSSFQIRRMVNGAKAKTDTLRRAIAQGKSKDEIDRLRKRALLANNRAMKANEKLKSRLKAQQTTDESNDG